MKNNEEIIEMFGLENEKIYFSNKGLVDPTDVKIINDYIWSEASGMLNGSECNCYVVIKDEKELNEEEYEKFYFAYVDKTEKYNESGEEYGKDRSYSYFNEGIDLSGSEVYILYNNYCNNNTDSYNVDIYKIK